MANSFRSVPLWLEYLGPSLAREKCSGYITEVTMKSRIDSGGAMLDGL